MRELSLFTGAGGGVLGSILLGWKPIGYVEWDEYCCRVLEQRIKDGCLPRAPIYQMDIREFNRRIAAKYQGVVDVITAGFPCQPFSLAGKRKGKSDDRNMWPATIECIRLVRPRFCLLENVPGLLCASYWGTILRDLAESGFGVRWRVLSAAEVGAPHKRDRVWIIASNNRSERIQRVRKISISGKSAFPWSQNVRRIEDLRNRSDIPSPQLCRTQHGMARYVDRIKALGNGQVPAVVRAAWELLR